jgi:hypothetical protein
LHLRDAGQGLLQVSSETVAVFRGVEKCVNVEEDIVFADGGVAVRLAVGGKRGVSDIVDSLVANLPFENGEEVVTLTEFPESVSREKLASFRSPEIKVRKVINSTFAV